MLIRQGEHAMVIWSFGDLGDFKVRPLPVPEFMKDLRSRICQK